MRTILKKLQPGPKPSQAPKGAIFADAEQYASTASYAEELVRARNLARESAKKEVQKAPPISSDPAATADPNESPEEVLAQIKREEAAAMLPPLKDLTAEKIEDLFKAGDRVSAESGMDVQAADTIDPVNDPNAHMKILRRDLRIQMKELKDMVAFGAASPEWQGFDREVEERLAVIDKEFMVSREPITKQSVARYQAARDAIVLETQSKWEAIQARRLALWRVWPQKADYHDPEVRPLAEKFVEQWWQNKRNRKLRIKERVKAFFAKYNITPPKKLPFELPDIWCWVQHTRFDPHEHTPPTTPVAPPAGNPTQHSPARNAYHQHTKSRHFRAGRQGSEEQPRNFDWKKRRVYGSSPRPLAASQQRSM